MYDLPKSVCVVHVFIIRGTFGVRQVTYAIKMKYFTIKTNSLFF